MNEKKFRQAVRNPRHIEGVFNYCDGWCERCPLTLRCSVYALTSQVEGRPPHDRGMETLWPRLETARGLARDLLRRHADHAGVGLAKDPVFKRVGEDLDAHRIGAAVRRYAEFAHQFLEKHRAALAASSAGETSPGEAAAEAAAVSLAEALEVIGTYHMLLLVKVSRALSRDEGDEEFESDPDFARVPRDQDGTAKLALIVIERSLLAWAVVSVRAAAHADGALSAMLTLERLRAAVEKEFPKARKFVRPGFDTVRFPEKR